jgi:hypothetical protein
MECNRIWDLISLYVDGEAGPEEAKAVEQHTAACLSCAQDLAMLQRTAGVLLRIPETEPPAALRQAILEATVYRPTFADRLRAAVSTLLRPMPVRYSLSAAAGAMVVMGIARLGSGPAPVTQVAELPAPPTASFPTTQPSPSLPAPALPAPATGREMAALPLASEPRTAVVSAKSPHGITPSHPQRVATPASSKTRQEIPSALKAGSPAEHRSVVSLIPTTTSIDEKIKVPTNPSEEFVPEIPPDVMEMMMKSGMMGEMGMTEPMKKPMPAEPAPSSGTAKIVLAASTRISPGQLATLADLKSSLKRTTADTLAAALPQTAKERAIKVDVLKSSF